MVIGKSVPMLDSVARVTGAVEYAVNLSLPRMLAGKLVRSTVAHARVVHVETAAAERVPGVVAILTGADAAKTYGVSIKDQNAVAAERVRYVGEPVVAVAAETREAAEEAAALVEIEYEELPAVFGAQEALKPGAPVLHTAYPNNVFRHAKIRHGDMETAFRAADEIFEDTFTSPVAQTVPLEPHVTAAQWDGERLTIWSGAQSPFVVRKVVAELFGIAPEAVRVIVPPLGGGYGGKGHVRIEPVAAALARKTGGRPVKIVLSRAEEFVTVTKHAASVTLKTGVRRDGTLAARQITVYWNGGAYADASPMLVQSGMVRSVGPYRIPVVGADSIGVYTNLPPAGAYRGAMSSQATWAYESQMDMIARRMGWDPLEFRFKNLLCDGDEFATGEKMHDVHFDECLRAVTLTPGPSPDAKIASGEGREGRGTEVRVGVGYAVMMKSTLASSKSQAILRLESSGVTTLLTSTVEMGQGAHTALAQITADAMSVPLASVRIFGPDTAVTPFDSSTNSSRSTNMMGTAVMNAARELKNKLISLAAPILESAPDELVAEDGRIRSPKQGESIAYTEVLARNNLDRLEAKGEHATAHSLDPETGQGVATPHWHQGAGGAEVEVDTETGKITILRYRGSAYAGRVVNPRLAQLQNDGNVIFGIGPALLEQLVFSDGQAVNTNLSDYSIPSLRDLPEDLQCVCVESGEAEGEMHGIGEMTLPPVAPAIANAIEDAIGVRITDLPITPDKVLRAIQAHASNPQRAEE